MKHSLFIGSGGCFQCMIFLYVIWQVSLKRLKSEVVCVHFKNVFFFNNLMPVYKFLAPTGQPGAPMGQLGATMGFNGPTSDSNGPSRDSNGLTQWAKWGFQQGKRGFQWTKQGAPIGKTGATMGQMATPMGQIVALIGQMGALMGQMGALIGKWRLWWANLGLQRANRATMGQLGATISINHYATGKRQMICFVDTAVTVCFMS